MSRTLYPTLEEALELHRILLERHGGAPGIRDQGLLECALFRPQTGHYESVSLQAAALLESLVVNHPFIDGNKRVAFALTAIFLRMNGLRLHVDANDGEHFLVETVIKGRAELSAIASWLEKRFRAI